MSPFIPARRLSAIELFLIPEALLAIAMFRFQISFLPSRWWMTGLSLDDGSGYTGGEKPVREIKESNGNTAILSRSRTIARVINGVSARTPWKSTCLVKVMAATKMLERRGITSRVHFGVKKSVAEDIEAHSWLSVAGVIIIGGENSTDYNEMDVSKT